VKAARTYLGAVPFPLILAAPSGAGKTTVARLLRERRDDVAFSVSATTRAPRSYERDGRDYHFLDEVEFHRMVEAGELVEWAEVHGNLYGTPLANFRSAVEQGSHLLLDIDVQGARQIRACVPEAISVFILPPSGSELAARLIGRASEPEVVRLRRLTNALSELEAAAEFDYVVVNDDLEYSVEAVEAILGAELLRPRRQSRLDGMVARLGEEIEGYLQRHRSTVQDIE
jgi:guanylate kinase